MLGVGVTGCCKDISREQVFEGGLPRQVADSQRHELRGT